MQLNDEIIKYEDILNKLNNYNKLHLYSNKLIKLKKLLKHRLERIEIIESECNQHLKLTINEIINNDNTSLTILIDNIINEIPEELRLENNIYILMMESFTIILKITKIIKYNFLYYIIPTFIRF